MNIKRTISFELERRKKDGELIKENVPIRMRIAYEGKRIDFTTGYRIDRNKWDESKQRVKNGTTNILGQSASEINTDLSQYFSDLQFIFKSYEVEGIVPETEQVKNHFNAKYSTKSEEAVSDETLDFFEVFDQFKKEEGRLNNWTYKTHEKFDNVKTILKQFDENLSFEALNIERLTDYVYFLQNKRKQRNSTIEKQISFLKWFLRWATVKGFNSNTAYTHFKPKLKTAQAKVIFLTQEELSKLRDYKIEDGKEYLERVRDVFLFSCFTEPILEKET